MKNQLLHTPEGVRDIYNEECEKKLELQDRLHKALKRHGYHSIQTPIFRYIWKRSWNHSIQRII